MRKSVCVLAIAMMAAPAMGAFYVAGSFNGWDSAGNLMTDAGGGVHTLDLTLGANERHEFKVTDGTWGDAWPETGNSWLITDAAGNISISYDTNVYADGWSGAAERIGLSVDPGTWTAAGDWQGWSNNDPATAMAPLGGGIYAHEATLAPGTYQYKALVTGSWDAIGADARGINANVLQFETTAENPIAIMTVDALTGIIRVDVVPEPAALSLLAIGATLLIRRRR